MRPNLSEQLVVLQVQHRVNLLFLRSEKTRLVQNFAGKIVLGSKKFDHISQGLKSLGWLSIEDRLRLITAVVHKFLHHRVPIYLKDKF